MYMILVQFVFTFNLSKLILASPRDTEDSRQQYTVTQWH